MSNVEMKCPNCGQTYALTPEQAPQYAGQTITCTQCKRPFVAVVPGYTRQPASAPPPMVGMAPGAASYPGPMTPQGPQQTNGLAIASLVTGLLGFCIPLTGIIAIILGAIGLKKTRDPRVAGKGLAIAGLVLGIVSTLFIVLQISILLPALNRAREQGNRVKCASNMRQIGLAVQMYANDNKGAFPPDIETALKAGDLTTQVVNCPSSSASRAPVGPNNSIPKLTLGQDLSYVYVGKNLNFAMPSNTVLLYEPPANHTPGSEGTRTNGGGNVLFVDGHVEYITDLNSVIGELNAGHNPPRPRGQRP